MCDFPRNANDTCKNDASDAAGCHLVAAYLSFVINVFIMRFINLQERLMVSNVALDANRVELVEQLHWLQPPTLNVASHVLWGGEMTLYDAE